MAVDIDLLFDTFNWLDHRSVGGVTEIRIIGGRAKALVAFVDNAETLTEICAKYNDLSNIYFGIQPRPIELFLRAPNRADLGVQGAKIEDIDTVMRTIIDLDPVREKDTPSTDAELTIAKSAANELAAHLIRSGYAEPTLCMSGNGVQLWMAFDPIQLDPQNRDHVSERLKMFEEDCRAFVKTLELPVKVDSIHDLPRIIKAIGTVSRKGVHSEERPHRLSVPIGIAPYDLSVVRPCAKLRAQLLEPVAEIAAKRTLQIFQPGQERPTFVGAPSTSSESTGRARREADGTLCFRMPVEMCSPMQRMWNEGFPDRSLALFDAMQWMLHKGLPDNEIHELILAYDYHGGQKLRNRDGAKYIQREIDKIVSTSGGRKNVKPPCHSLQKVKFCPVNNEPETRCELYDFIFDIGTSIDKIPSDVDPDALTYRLKVLYRAMVETAGPDEETIHIGHISKRFGLAEDHVRQQLEDERFAYAMDTSEDVTPPATATGDGSEPPSGGKPPSGPGSDHQDEARLDGQVIEDGNNYTVLVGKKGDEHIISSFVLHPKTQIMLDEEAIFECEAHCDNGTTSSLKITSSAFDSRKTFLGCFSQHSAMQWVGNDNNVQGVKRIISRKPSRKRIGVTTLGEVEHQGQRYWALPDRVLSKDGIEADPPVVYLKTGNPLDNKLRYDETNDSSFSAIASKIFELILKINSPQAVIPMLGWFFATPMKPRLMKSVGSFPTLWVHGTRGSGKTSMITSVFWPLFGLSDSAAYGSNPTEWSLIRILCQTTSIPVFLDEYKPQDQSRMLALHRILREHYTGDIQSRGQRNLSVQTFKLSSPVIIAGETRPTEAAILERIITSMPDKTELEKNEEWRNAFKQIRSVDLGYFIARYARFCLGQELENHMHEARRQVECALEGVKKSVPIRVRNNLNAMALGVRLFEQFAQACNYTSLPENIGLAEGVLAVVDDLIETDQGVKDPLDHFLETCGTMALQKEILYKRNYTVSDHGFLCLHLNTCYAAYRKHLKQIDYRGEIVDQRAMERLAEQNFRRNGFVRQVCERVSFDDQDRRNAMIVEFARTELIERPNFPTTEIETYRPRSSYEPTKEW